MADQVESTGERTRRRFPILQGVRPLARDGILDDIGVDALATSVPHAAEAFDQATADG